MKTCPNCYGTGSVFNIDFGIISCPICEGAGLTEKDFISSESQEERIINDFIKAGKAFLKEQNKKNLENLKFTVYRAESFLDQKEKNEPILF